jgi:hypothetical protein
MWKSITNTLFSNDNSDAAILFSNGRSINYFWHEKILLLIDMLQIYGILWNMANSWYWPYLWIIWTKWAVWGNLDWFSTTNSGALSGKSMNDISRWGELHQYFLYGLLFSAIPALGNLIILLLEYYRSSMVWYQNNNRYKIQTWWLTCLAVTYMPCSLALSRIYYCEHGRVAVDPYYECMSSTHILYMCIYAVLYGPVFIGLPYIIYKLINSNIIYNTNYDHEKRLQAYEISYMLNIDTFYHSSHMWLISSYKRNGIYFTLYNILFKLLLIIIYMTLRFNRYIQSFILWLIILFYLLLCIYQRPYRHYSSNILLIVIYIMLFINTTFALFNSFNVLNAILVTSTETMILLAFNSLGVLCILIFMLYMFWVVNIIKSVSWFSLETLTRISYSYLFPKVLHWIQQIRIANDVNLSCYLANYATCDIPMLEHSIRILHKSWLVSTSVGSIFSIILSDTLDKLIITHSKLSKYSYRRFDYYDNNYITNNNIFEKYNIKYKLMNSKKRKILLKLFTLKVFNDLRKKCKRNYNNTINNNTNINNDTTSSSIDMITIGNKLTKLKTYMEDGMDYNLIDTTSDVDANSRSRSNTVINTSQLIQWNSLDLYEQTNQMCIKLTKETEQFISEYRIYQRKSQLESSNQSHTQINSSYVGELYEKWSSIIYQYETQLLPGGSLFSNNQIEEWYVYRKYLEDVFRDIDSSDEDDNSDNNSAYNHDVMSVHSRNIDTQIDQIMDKDNNKYHIAELMHNTSSMEVEDDNEGLPLLSHISPQPLA